MRKEFPFPGGAPLLGPSPGEVDRGQEQVQVARAFGLIRINPSATSREPSIIC